MYVIKKRCGRCLHVLRDDGTCQNPKCVRYVKEDTATATTTANNAASSTANNDTAPSTTSSSSDTAAMTTNTETA